MKKALLFLLGFLCSMHVAGQWTELKGPAGGRVSQIQRDATNSTLYALVDGRIYTSTVGDTWTLVNTPFGSAQAFFAAGSQLTVVYFEGSWISMDGGATWEVKYNQQNNFVQLFKGASSTHLFARAYNGIFVSTDGGTSFKQILSVTGSANVLDLKQTSNGDLFAIENSRGIIKLPFPSNASDLASWFESNWVVVHPRLTNNLLYDFYGLAITSTDKIFLTIPDENTSNSVLFKSSINGGANWTDLSMTGYAGSNFPQPRLIATPAGKLLMYDISMKQGWEYTDGAPTPWVSKPWPTSVRSEQVIYCLAYRNTDLLVGAESDGIFRSSNGGNSWSQSSSGMNVGGGYQVAVLDNGKILVTQGFEPPGFYFSADNGNTWNFKSTAFRILTLIKLPDNTLFILDNQGGTHTSTDGGDNWQDNPVDVLKKFVVVAANDIYGFGEDGLIKESINKGVNWTGITSTGLPADYKPYAVARDADGFFYIMLVNNANSTAELWRLDSNTLPWTAAKMTTSMLLSGTSALGMTLYVTGNKVYATDSEENNYFSLDHGLNWQKLNANGALLPLNGGIAVSTIGNIAITQDDGLTVRNIALPSPRARITQLGTNAVGGFYIASAVESPTLKFTGSLVLPADQLEPYIDYGWTPVAGGPFGGYVNRVGVNSLGQVFATSAFSLYRYEAGTQTWSKRGPTLQIGEFTIDGTNNIYGVDPVGRTFKSTDNGDTFTAVGDMGANVNSIQFIGKAPSGTIFVTTRFGIYRSTNDAVSFTKVADGDCYFVAASDNGTLLAAINPGTTGSVLRSVDDGITWTPLSVTLPAGELAQTTANGGSNSLVLMSRNSLLRSTDGGNTWTPIMSGLPAFNIDGLARPFSRAPNGDYYFKVDNDYYVSSNNGGSWTKKTTGGEAASALAWSGSNAYGGALRSGVVKSSDNGATFQAMPTTGIMGLGFRGMEIIDGRLIVADGVNGILTSDNDGASFTQTYDQGGRIIYGLIKTPNDHLFAYGLLTGILRSTDRGTTWTSVPLPQGLVNVFQLSSSDGITFYAVIQDGSDQKIYVTSNLTSWTLLPATGMPAGLNVRSMVNDGPTVYFVNGFDLWQLAFGVANKVPGLPQIAYVQYGNGKVYALSSTADALYEKTASGWLKKTVPRGSHINMTPRNQWYIIGATLQISRDQGITWQNVGAAIQNTALSVIRVNEYTGYAYALTQAGVLKSNKLIFPDDKTAPLRTSINPVDDAVNIALDAKLSITFDEASFPVASKKIRVFKVGVVNAVAELDVTAGVRTGKTYTYTIPPLTYLTQYYVVVDNGSFKDLFGNFYTGIGDQASWTFTTLETPDTQAPVIANPAVGNLDVGTGNKEIQFIVTDNKAIDISSAKFFVGAVTTAADPIAGALSSTGTGSSVTFKATIGEADYKSVGIAFYFEVADALGNKSRYPATAGTFDYSYLTYPASQNPALPALAAGGKKSNYKMISLPFEFGSSNVSTLFAGLGAPARDVWRLLTHGGGATTNWLEYGNSDFSTIDRGVGYWINVKAPIEVKVPQASVPANHSGSWFIMQLKPGWNQIGNPYTVPISWEAVRSTNPDAIGKLKVFNPSTLSYTTGDVMEKFGAGFVFLNFPSPLPVTIRFQGFTTGRKAEPRLGTDLGLDTWQLPITLTQGSSTSEFSGIGMHPEADNEMDRFDDLNPPPFLKLMEMNFEHPQGVVKRLAMDVVTTAEDYRWNFNVGTDTDEEVRLQWDNTEMGDNSKELFLFNEGDQSLTNMREQNTFAFKPVKGNRFRIYFGENLSEKIKPSKVLAGNPFPNPSNGMTTIPFTIGDNYEHNNVTLDVVDVLGRPVARVIEGEYKPGFYKAVWDARDHNTVNGLYVFRLVVESNGVREVQTGKVVVGK